MKKQNRSLFRVALSAIVLVAATILPLFQSNMASAQQIANRSLTLQGTGNIANDINSDGVADGGSMPGGTVNHLLQFDVPSTTLVDTIRFEYCTTAASVSGGVQCDVPTGVNASTATLGLDGSTGWTITNQTANTVTLSGTAANLSGTKTFRLDSVVNPTDANKTFFVRIATHDSTIPADVDTGTVAASTAEAIILTGTMPESLVFCTGETISLNAGVNECTTATPGQIAFDKLFSPTETAIATSQMSASTNAGAGYAITVNGPTMTSGSNTIAAMGTLDTSKLGNSQFGMNLKANATPLVGAEVSAASDGVNLNGQALGDYAIADSFKFVTGQAVANSNSVATDAQIFTASYIVNVPGSQPAGTYATTLTYIATPTF